MVKGADLSITSLQLRVGREPLNSHQALPQGYFGRGLWVGQSRAAELLIIVTLVGMIIITKAAKACTTASSS